MTVRPFGYSTSVAEETWNSWSPEQQHDYLQGAKDTAYRILVEQLMQQGCCKVEVHGPTVRARNFTFNLTVFAEDNVSARRGDGSYIPPGERLPEPMAVPATATENFDPWGAHRLTFTEAAPPTYTNGRILPSATFRVDVASPEVWSANIRADDIVNNDTTVRPPVTAVNREMDLAATEAYRRMAEQIHESLRVGNVPFPIERGYVLDDPMPNLDTEESIRRRLRAHNTNEGEVPF